MGTNNYFRNNERISERLKSLQGCLSEAVGFREGGTLMMENVDIEAEFLKAW